MHAASLASSRPAGCAEFAGDGASKAARTAATPTPLTLAIMSSALLLRLLERTGPSVSAEIL